MSSLRSMLKWPLTPLLRGADAVVENRSNGPSLRDLEVMLEAFREWKAYYDKEAKEKRERHAKLELIGDTEAQYVKYSRDSAEKDAARCDVGIRTLTWAIDQIRKGTP